MAQLYAIVGTMDRARLMLDAGVPYLQLRFKEMPLEVYFQEISTWTEKYPDTRLIINDDLHAAHQVGAWGVHMGQEDLTRYKTKEFRKATVNLGISTHTDEEIDLALRYNPAMLGFGPILQTKTKIVSHYPQGVYRLAEIVAKTPLPIVAIGGISEENLESVLETNVAMIAMISNLDNYQTANEVQALMTLMDKKTH